MNGKLARALILVTLACSTAVGPARASYIPAVGVLNEVPIALAADLYAGGQLYQVVAYEQGDSFHMIVGHDHVLAVHAVDQWSNNDLSSMALSQSGFVWKLEVSTTSVDLGSIHLSMTTPETPSDGVVGCGDFFDFVSPSGSVSGWGVVSGTIGTLAVDETVCLGWGSAVSGDFHVL